MDSIKNSEIRVFVSGCYDILHGGHIQFFTEAKALGSHLTVSFASQDVLWHHKMRRSSIPDEHKQALISSLSMVDECVIGLNPKKGLDFIDEWERLQPHILAVTEDDKYSTIKKELCARTGAKYIVLPKTPPKYPPVSTSGIIRSIKAPDEVPLRVDIAGGWLDVPRYAIDGKFVVNCAISPCVSLRDWKYNKKSGLGGSGAFAVLSGRDAVAAEVEELGVGWQDPAIIMETGLCVWHSGPTPKLCFKTDGSMLRGKMLLYWTGQYHDTPAAASNERNYDQIAAASVQAAIAIRTDSFDDLCTAVNMSYKAQLDEGMAALPDIGHAAAKYCGGGWGGYAVYIFTDNEQRNAATKEGDFIVIEPFIRDL